MLVVSSPVNVPVVPVIADAWNGAATMVKLLVASARAVVVPTIKPSSLSSQTNIALSPVEPRSMIIPVSSALDDAPLFSSSKWSVIVVLVVLIVVLVVIVVF